MRIPPREAEAGLGGAAGVSQQVRHGQSQDGRGGADDNHVQGVLARKINRSIGGAQKAQDLVHEKPSHGCVDQADQQRAADGIGADLAALVVSLLAHEPGDQTAAAHAEEIGKGHVQHGKRQGHGRRRHHIRVAGSSNEKSVYNIIDKIDELADDGGDPQGGQRPRNGHLFKQLGLG